MGHQKALISLGCLTYKRWLKPSIEFVLIVMRVHLFPSRTQKLSSCTPTILGGRLPGKIGNANTKPRSLDRGFFQPAGVHRTLADGRTIPGLPRKIDNANIKPRFYDRGFFLCPKNTTCYAGGAKKCVYFRLDIITPPHVVIILHKGAFCLLSVFTGSVHSRCSGVFYVIYLILPILFRTLHYRPS